jgi:uncharacterized protein (TIGR02246 family)
MRILFPAIVLAGLTAVSWPIVPSAWAQEERDQKKDTAGVRAAAREYLEALRRGDLKAAAEVWTADGEYTDAAGTSQKARKLLAEQTAAAGDEAVAEAEVKLPDSTLRFVTPDVAVEDGKTKSELSEDGRLVAGKFTAVWVKRDGKWRLDSLRESAVVPPSASERLQPLEWLNGEWVGATDRGVILVSSRWCDAGHFILREFVERAADGGVTTGSQRIGWDPSIEKIKCWTFDSHGGSAEGIWRQEGDRWIVETTEVMPDGSKAAALSSYTPAGDGRFVWEASRGKIGDKTVPTRSVEFKRAAER